MKVIGPDALSLLKIALSQATQFRDTRSQTLIGEQSAKEHAHRLAVIGRGFASRDWGRIGGEMDGMQDDLTGINEVARMLAITPRTLRFYEDKGLITPCRVGAIRVYTRREIARMRLILRGKRLGFSLRDIVEFLNLYDADPQHVEQMRALAERCRQRIDRLAAQQEAIAETLIELETIEREALDRIPARSRKPRATGVLAREPAAGAL